MVIFQKIPKMVKAVPAPNSSCWSKTVSDILVKVSATNNFSVIKRVLYSGNPHITGTLDFFWKIPNFGVQFGTPHLQTLWVSSSTTLTMCSIGVPLGQFQGILDLLLFQLSGITMVHHHLQTIIWAKLAALSIMCFFHICIKCPWNTWDNWQFSLLMLYCVSSPSSSWSIDCSGHPPCSGHTNSSRYWNWPNFARPNII